MSDPWPTRLEYRGHAATGDSQPVIYSEPDTTYLIRMVQQLFVELAKVNAKLDKPLYQITMPPQGIDPLFGFDSSSHETERP